MDEQFVAGAPELNYLPGNRLEDMEDRVPDAAARVVVKTVAMNVATEDISHEIVVAVDVAGNFPLPCALFQEASER